MRRPTTSTSATRASSGGGVWRLHYDHVYGEIDRATQIVATPDRVETVTLGPDAGGTAARDVFYTTKRAGEVRRILDPTADPANPADPALTEVLAVLGGTTEEDESEVTAMAATEDALYLADRGVKRLSLAPGGAAPPQPVAGFEGREISALAIDPTRGRLYAGTVAPQLGDIVEVLDLATGDREPYEQGFATVTSLGVAPDGAVLVADDPALASQFTLWQARLWRVPVARMGRPQALITDSAAAVSAAAGASFAYSTHAAASFECRLDARALQ